MSLSPRQQAIADLRTLIPQLEAAIAQAQAAVVRLEALQAGQEN